MSQDESKMLVKIIKNVSFNVLAIFIVVYAEMLQLLRDFDPQTPYRGSGLRPPDPRLSPTPKVPPPTPPMGQ